MAPTAPTPVMNLEHVNGLGSPALPIEQQLDPGIRFNAIA
jgi:hypothetical protein